MVSYLPLLSCEAMGGDFKQEPLNVVERTRHKYISKSQELIYTKPYGQN